MADTKTLNSSWVHPYWGGGGGSQTYVNQCMKVTLSADNDPNDNSKIKIDWNLILTNDDPVNHPGWVFGAYYTNVSIAGDKVVNNASIESYTPIQVVRSGSKSVTRTSNQKYSVSFDTYFGDSSQSSCHSTYSGEVELITNYTVSVIVNGNGTAGVSEFPWDSSAADFESSVSVIPNSTVYLQATPSTGHHFVNWTKNSVIESTTPNFSITVIEDQSLTANFAVDQHTIVAHSEGGTFTDTTGWTQDGSNYKKTVDYNDVYGSLPTVTKNNYSFDGWYTAPTGGTLVTSATVCGGDADIYAHWIYTGLVLRFHGNGADQDYDTYAELMGFTWVNNEWYKEVLLQENDALCNPVNDTFEAAISSNDFFRRRGYELSTTDIWLINSRTLRTYNISGEWEEIEGVKKYKCSTGSTFEEYVATASDLYEWVSGNTWDPAVEKVIDLYLYWNRVSYNANFTPNGGSWHSSVKNPNVPYNIVQVLKAPSTISRNHWTFAGWKVIETDAPDSWPLGRVFLGTNSDDVASESGHYGNVSLQAQWEPITYNISCICSDSDDSPFGRVALTGVVPEGNTTTTVTAEGVSEEMYVMEGSTATLVAKSNGVYTFKEWYLDGVYAGTNPTLTISSINEDHEIDGYFDEFTYDGAKWKPCYVFVRINEYGKDKWRIIDRIYHWVNDEWKQGD